MRRIAGPGLTRGALAVLMLVCIASWAPAADSYEIEVYPCPRAWEGVVVDGALHEAVWERAPAVNEFTFYNKPELVDVQTHVRMAYDHRALYFGVVCDEPNIDKLAQVSQVRDAHEVFHGETIELFIDPNHDQNEYYQIAVNAAASMYDSIRTDPSWSADLQAATIIGEQAWALEVAVPWADLGVKPEAGAVMGVNVCRDRYLGANRVWSNWSQTAANFHDPQRFGHIVLSPSPMTIGDMELELRKGERSGPIVIHGPEHFAQAAYRTLARAAIDRAARLLTDLERTGAQEADVETQRELSSRIADYREELAGFEETATSDQPVPPHRWQEITQRLGAMRGELDRVIWEARLAALLSSI
ncbi:MAG: sugar-binding protein [Armatimonadota bacterium]|nr:sugar-binding protein [Armatimonadota bacterium]